MDEFEALKTECLSCRRCPLCESRKNVVFGVGNPKSELLFIGEGPGEQEDIHGEPFVGAAGHFLDDMLELIQLDRSKVYIANIVKCRPPHNRDPLGEEQEACSEWLMRQMDYISPKLIVCLGRIAGMRFIDPNLRITRQHGVWYDRNGVFVTAFYHPSALLRDPSKRPEAFEDLKGLQKMINRYCEHIY